MFSRERSSLLYVNYNFPDSIICAVEFGGLFLLPPCMLRLFVASRRKQETVKTLPAWRVDVVHAGNGRH